MSRENGKMIEAEDRFGGKRANVRSGFFTRSPRKLFELYVDAMTYITFAEAERKLREDYNL